jgi:UDP-2,4-diacetamido-2,4,6-trideoxy-beta-L-altropyranose hydrolase
MNQPLLICRVDANAQIGLGHLMRSLALAEAWRRAGGQAFFFMRPTSPRVGDCLTACGFRIETLRSPGPFDDLHRTIATCRVRRAAWLSVDGYHFDSEYFDGLRSAGIRSLALDGEGRLDRCAANIVLNQNLGACVGNYIANSDTSYLCGPTYALVRSQFVARRGVKKTKCFDAPRRVLITMGGADPANLTPRVLAALEKSRIGLEIRALVGPATPRQEFLVSLARQSRHRVEILVDCQDVARQMAWADLAIGAAGSTCWELACMGVPMLLVTVAENQQPVAAALDRQGLAMLLGSHETLRDDRIVAAVERLLAQPRQLSEMSRRGQSLIDGQGAARVVEIMLRGAVFFRAVSREDCKLLWHWANDLETRRASFCSSPICWREHVSWFLRRAAAFPTAFLALDARNRPLGVVRFDLEGEEATISLTVAPTWRGQGHGGRIVRAACDEMFGQIDAARIVAYVKPDNFASIQLFKRSGFRFEGEVLRSGQTALRFSLTRTSRRAGLDPHDLTCLVS